MSKPQRLSTSPMASDYPRKERVCAECGKPKPILLTFEKIGGGFVMMCSGCAPQRNDTFDGFDAKSGVEKHAGQIKKSKPRKPA